MTEQNQAPDTAADDTEGHVHFRMSEVDDAAGHILRSDSEDGTEDRRPMHRDDEGDDAEGHMRRDDEGDDAEGHMRRDDEDVEGHLRARGDDDDDAEGHLHKI